MENFNDDLLNIALHGSVVVIAAIEQKVLDKNYFEPSIFSL